jgi:ERCC4-type nuclease
MVLLCDTRQKAHKHLNIEGYCREHNITMIPQCLNVGDYQIRGGQVCVDTKADLLELAQDLHRDRKSFNKKYKKAYKERLKLIVLVEQPIKSRRDIISWKSKRTKITGRYLFDMITDLRLSYGIKFMFCDKKDTGRVLINLLTQGENNDTEQTING